MSRLPERPTLDWKDDGTPVARTFDDVYFSLSDGLEETRNVFLRACGLPERWKNCHSFTIAELGFGSGLNFLGTLDCWVNAEKPADAWLHFTSVEKFLMRADEAGRILGKWPELAHLSEDILARWPVLTRGLQRIIFPEYRVTLTLYIGDVEAWLSTCMFEADAWFLDGFAPAKNDAMWSEAVFKEIASHSAKDCRIGTYTVAGAVRRALADVGFSVSKAPGFGRKRERLEAVWTADAQSNKLDLYLPNRQDVRPTQVVIIGAGIAGACLATAFGSRGLPVTVFDKATAPAAGASGNRYGLVMPRLDAADTSQARLLLHAYLFALRFYRGIGRDHVCDAAVDQIAGHEAETVRFGKLLSDPPLEADWLSGNAGRLQHHNALIVSPELLVPELLAASGATLELGAEVPTIKQLQERFGSEALIVVASGWQVSTLLPQMDVPLTGKLGQVEWFAGNDAYGVSEARASGTYAIRNRGEVLFGATFEAIDEGTEPEVSDAARAENIRAFEALCPDWRNELARDVLSSRSSVRATTPDRMPLAGAAFNADVVRDVLVPLAKGAPVRDDIPYDARLMILSGLGARGFTFAPLLAELLVAQTLNEPLPLARPELEQIAPVRFLVRAAKRGG